MSGVERVLGHESLQKIDVALKASRSLVQAGRFRAVLYSGDILRTPGFDPDDDQTQAQHRDSDHALSPFRSCLPPARFPHGTTSDAEWPRGSHAAEYWNARRFIIRPEQAWQILRRPAIPLFLALLRLQRHINHLAFEGLVNQAIDGITWKAADH